MADFTEYGSKKRLREAKVLSDGELAIIEDIKCVFSVSLHNGRRYAALTLYNDKWERAYRYAVLDFETGESEEYGSIRLAKNAVRERLGKPAPRRDIPRPSCALAAEYLRIWDTSPELYEPERVLQRLFTEMYPTNTDNDLDGIILKAAALNTVYNTYIYSVYPVVLRILAAPDVDARLHDGDETLVGDIMRVKYGDGRKIDHYSFAAKYCSFHNPDAFPIYDSYVDRIMRYFRDKDGFLSFEDGALRDYPSFKRVISRFRAFYGLEKYTVKETDRFLWQLGRDCFRERKASGREAGAGNAKMG